MPNSQAGYAGTGLTQRRCLQMGLMAIGGLGSKAKNHENPSLEMGTEGCKYKVLLE